MIKVDRNGFRSINLKVANMRNEQNFTIYPYNGGDTITVQSDKRIAVINLKNGIGAINSKNEQGGAYFHHLNFGLIKFKIEDELKTALQEMLWNNSGEEGGKVVKWENKELFSK